MAQKQEKISSKMIDRILTHNSEFRSYERPHYSVLAVTLVLSVGLPLIAIHLLDAAQQVWLNRIIALYISGVIVIWTIFRIHLKRFDHKNDLPLDICNVIALCLPFLMWHPSQAVNEILYFWILVGTLQAILTPNVEDGYPTYTFFKYFTVHSGLVVYIVYSTTVFGLYPDWSSIWKSIVYLHVYAVAILVVNLIIGSNYFYILRKPNKPSLLDYLGPWPWYILSCEVLIFVMCVIVYLPVWLLR